MPIAFSQAVNYDKLHLIFSPSTLSWVKSNIKYVLHTMEKRVRSHYLGVLLYGQSLASSHFQRLSDKVSNKIASWKWKAMRGTPLQ